MHYKIDLKYFEEKIKNVFSLTYYNSITNDGIWAITKILGHFHPIQTLRSYVHVIDIIYHYIIRYKFEKHYFLTTQLKNLLPNISFTQSFYNLNDKLKINNKKILAERFNENYLLKQIKVIKKIYETKYINPTYNCKKNNREIIASNFYIEPVAYIKLPKFEIKISCTGQVIRENCYYFSYKSKHYNKSGIFCCGKKAGKFFISKLNLTKPPLFNPHKKRKIIKGKKSEYVYYNQKKWNPVMYQLFLAVNFIIISWDIKPGYTICSILKDINSQYFKEPSISMIKGVNTIISRDKKRRTLKGMIEELRKVDKQIPEFEFGLLTERLEKIYVKSYFE